MSGMQGATTPNCRACYKEWSTGNQTTIIYYFLKAERLLKIMVYNNISTLSYVSEENKIVLFDFFVSDINVLNATRSCYNDTACK